MLHKFRAASAAEKTKTPVAPLSTPAASVAPATVESLGQQLREVLPTRRLQSVSLCDHEANVLWLSEGALGPDEHMLVMEALDILKADSSLPCHETSLEDGRLGVFLPVRAPTGTLVGVAMILADSKSVGDDTLERMTAGQVRTIMQRLAVLLKPNGVLDAAPIPVELPEEIVEETPEPEPIVVEAKSDTLVEVAAVELELALVPEIEITAPAPQAPPVVAPPPPVVAAAPVVSAAPSVVPAARAEPAPEEDDPVISAAEIASILELELVADGEPPAPAPAAKGKAPPAAPAPAAAEIEDEPIADSGMLKLEFLAEPPVVRPAQNPTAVARKLQAASKAAEVAPTRAPRALPVAPARPAAAPAPTPAPVAKAKAPAVPTAPARAAPAAPAGAARNPFEPVPAHSRLSLHSSDEDVVVLFESEPVSLPSRAAIPAAKAPPLKPAPTPPPQAATPAPAKPVPIKPAPPARIQPAVRAAPPVRTAPAVRNVPVATAAPVARAPAPAPVAAPAPAPAVIPIVVPVVSAAPAAAAPIAAPPVSAPAEAAPAVDLVPFARLRAGGQNRRFQAQPRNPAAQRDAAADEQMVQELLAWLGNHRSLWNSVPTTFTVNLSIATLEDERFLTKVAAALNTHGISGETLGFEIAETLCAQQRAKVERFIAQCEKIGTWVAIDDFSFDSQVLPLLRSKALRLLKLDARLSAAALRDKLSQAMLVATVQAAKVLGIHTSAKKADSQASLQYLAAIGLDYAQGTALARTVPIESIGTAGAEEIQ